jgi:hypothetical protein
VTEAPNPSFIPPSGRTPYTASDGRFYFGAPGLWALVTPHWKLGSTGNKLPYFSENYNPQRGDWEHLEMAVFARRLDAPAPLVWVPRVSGTTSSPGAMITGLDIPTTGCWEVTARYHPAGRDPEILSYTVLVEP